VQRNGSDEENDEQMQQRRPPQPMLPRRYSWRTKGAGAASGALLLWMIVRGWSAK
jgi:hypothetical protein